MGKKEEGKRVGTRGERLEGREVVEREETRKRRHSCPVSESNGAFTMGEIDYLNSSISQQIQPLIKNFKAENVQTHILTAQFSYM